MLQDKLQVAYGTVTGRDHTFGGNLVLGKSNQDAIATAWMDDAFVAVLCDGCSSGAHSEVGAQLTARIILTLLQDQFGTMPGIWGGEEPGLTGGIWSFGDCCCWKDGRSYLPFFAGNAPPYLAYRLFPPGKVSVAREDLAFYELLPIQQGAPRLVVDLLENVARSAVRDDLSDVCFLLQSSGLSMREAVEQYLLCTVTVVIVNANRLEWLPVVIGTDGLKDVPDPSVFLEDRFFQNPAILTRYLRQLNQPKVRIEPGDSYAQIRKAIQLKQWHPEWTVDQLFEEAVKVQNTQPRLVKTDGSLPDDTTVLAIRRAPCE